MARKKEPKEPKAGIEAFAVKPLTKREIARTIRQVVGPVKES